MNKKMFELAASSVIVSMTMMATTAQSQALRRVDTATPAEARAVRDAGALHEQARRAVQQGQLSEALGLIEQAVALSPRDAGYRLLLADIYLRNGRFESASATYADVLELDPSNARAGLSFALMQIALGRPQAAVGQLDAMASHAAAADVGLAYALAGLPERAIEVLEPAARAHDATPRLRQNLALSYALAGDWRRARSVAAQDLPPSEVGARMVEWARMARPDSGPTQVASLLGVNPVADAGQPVRLALRNAPAEVSAPVQVAAAAPAFSAPAEPAVYAEAAPIAAPAAVPVPASDSVWGQPAAQSATTDMRPYYTAAPQAAATPEAQAARTLTRPSAPVIQAAAVSLPRAPVFQRERPSVPVVRSGNSNFVVQIGAFSNEGNAERAWLDAKRRFNLGERAPLTATINVNGRTMHRVAVAGFASQADAGRMCGAIRAGGGVCFVRANAGDASIRWAARYASDRTRRA